MSQSITEVAEKRLSDLKTAIEKAKRLQHIGQILNRLGSTVSNAKWSLVSDGYESFALYIGTSEFRTLSDVIPGIGDEVLGLIRTRLSEVVDKSSLDLAGLVGPTAKTETLQHQPESAPAPCRRFDNVTLSEFMAEIGLAFLTHSVGVSIRGLRAEGGAADVLFPAGLPLAEVASRLSNSEFWIIKPGSPDEFIETGTILP